MWAFGGALIRTYYLVLYCMCYRYASCESDYTAYLADDEVGLELFERLRNRCSWLGQSG